MRKLINISIITLVAAIGFQAHAGFTGKWIGAGKVSNNQGMALNCEKVEIVISHTAVKMDIDSKFFCGTRMVQGPQGSLAIRGTDVFNAQGEKIGIATEDTVSLSSKNGNAFMTSEEKIINGSMIFKTVHGAANGLVTTYEGQAKR